MSPSNSSQGRGDKPDSGQRGQLISKLAQMGFVAQDLAEFITDGQTYGEIAENLILHINIKNK